ncbi:MAG: ABC transporter ATP-binding protein, partial [Eubacteriales bacterium]|nr:ABC transporter ATP-binding protein [Eubacteriales bacterium]
MLELRGIGKTFARGTVNEHTALTNINFSLGDGDFVTILGSNGAGK